VGLGGIGRGDATAGGGNTGDASVTSTGSVVLPTGQKNRKIRNAIVATAVTDTPLPEPPLYTTVFVLTTRFGKLSSITSFSSSNTPFSSSAGRIRSKSRPRLFFFFGARVEIFSSPKTKKR
jgi:hypothetical protein